jgi:hypothetical protein
MKEIYPNQVKSNKQLMALRDIERKDKKRYIIMTKNTNKHFTRDKTVTRLSCFLC